MKKWKYIKGSESDFDDAPDWACLLTDVGDARFFLEGREDGCRGLMKGFDGPWFTIDGNGTHPHEEIIAERQLLASEEQDLNECIGATEANAKVGKLHIDGKVHCAQLGDGNIPALRAEGGSKYHREIKPGAFVDVYDVLAAWNVTNPALQHLIKKALQPGARGHKTTEQDMQDIIDSAIRAKQLGA